MIFPSTSTPNSQSSTQSTNVNSLSSSSSISNNINGNRPSSLSSISHQLQFNQQSSLGYYSQSQSSIGSQSTISSNGFPTNSDSNNNSGNQTNKSARNFNFMQSTPNSMTPNYSFSCLPFPTSQQSPFYQFNSFSNETYSMLPNTNSYPQLPTYNTAPNINQNALMNRNQQQIFNINLPPPSYPPPEPPVKSFIDLQPPKTQPPPLPNMRNNPSQTNRREIILNDLIDLTTEIEHKTELTTLEEFDPLSKRNEQPPPLPPTPTPQPTQSEQLNNSNKQVKLIEPPPTNSHQNRRASFQEKGSMLIRVQSTPNHQKLTTKDDFNTKSGLKVAETSGNDNRRRSYSDYERADFLDHYELVDKEILSEDFVAFQGLIDDFRLKIELDEEKELTNIAVFSPLLERPITKELSVNLIVRHQQIGGSSNKIRQIKLTSSISCSVEHIIYEVLIEFQMNDLDINKYLLKIHGLEEYLPIDAILCELKYMQDCLVVGVDPTLILIELKNINTQLTSFEINDENLTRRATFIAAQSSNDFIKPFQFKIVTPTPYKPERYNVNFLINAIQEHRKALKSMKTDKQELKSWCYVANEKLKMLPGYIFGIYYNPLYVIIDKIKALINELAVMYSEKELKLVHDKLVNKSNEAMHACVRLVNCASESFLWDVKLEYGHSSHKPLKIYKEISACDEYLFFYVNSINKLSSIYQASTISTGTELQIGISVYYGNFELDSFRYRLDRYDKKIERDFYVLGDKNELRIDSIKLCQLPREAVLVFKLIALENGSEMKCLAWGSKALFNDNLELIAGEFFLCLFPGDNVLTCTSASNIYSEKSPIVYISCMEKPNHDLCLFKNETIYVYPPIIDIAEIDCHNFELLKDYEKKEMLQLISRSLLQQELNEIEKEKIRSKASYLSSIPNSLAKLYLSNCSWSYDSMIKFYGYLKQYETLSTAEALEILQPRFPDIEIRNLAVRSLSFLNDEALSIYMPQLLEALKYERANNSALMRLLIQYSVKNIRFAHKLYWHLKEFRSRKFEFIPVRYELLYQGLTHLFSKALLNEIKQECQLVDKVDEIGQLIKKSKDISDLHKGIEELLNQWPKYGSCRLPYDISFCTNGIDIKNCAYISSFTVPLKLCFKNLDPSANSFFTIYKIGDDLRQDQFVIQLINVMNQLWILNDLDLSVMTFNCLQTGDKRGFIEMITNAETLKEIQNGSVLNVFDKSCIYEWLRFHNPVQSNFNKAVSNFTRSCAAYSVATYVLGICDRHNDNVMVKYSGHMFHIDFGKYLGDSQMFAGFKRDRTPMLFTQDMCYVINRGASELNECFQEFVVMCCQALQILRENCSLLLTLIGLMADSGIPGLNKTAINFVYNKLMMNLNEDQASEALTKMIKESLKTLFPTLNYAIHSLAQSKANSNQNHLFPFVNQTYTKHTDGIIMRIDVDEDFRNVTGAGEEVFKCIVSRENDYQKNEVYRTFSEFCLLYQHLQKTFPQLKLSDTPILSKFKDFKGEKRRINVGFLINNIFKLQSEIRDSDIVYTFFHKTLRDQKDNGEETPDYSALNEKLGKRLVRASNARGQIKIRLNYRENKFVINILFARNLVSYNPTLRPYVKTYLRPDAQKLTKKKAQAILYGPNPVFNQTMEYEISLEELRKRQLEIIVSDNNRIGMNDKIGSVKINLNATIGTGGEVFKWYDLE